MAPTKNLVSEPAEASGVSENNNSTPASKTNKATQHFEIQPILELALPDVARFLSNRRGSPVDGSGAQPVDLQSIEGRLRWLLVRNPAGRNGSQHGFCIRDEFGAIRGLTLCFPGAFLVEDRRILGLCWGSFFVDTQARTLGFYLFKKKHLSGAGFSFFYTTTCNINSAALWRGLGGCAIPNSEVEYIVPIKLENLLPRLANGRTSSRVASRIARVVGRWADPIRQFLHSQSAQLTIEPCQDWQKLSELFRRHRRKEQITAERSSEFLQWRYEQSLLYYPSKTFLFRDTRGNEGWFALGSIVRGRRGQICGSALLDVVWPRQEMSFKEIFPAIIQLAAAKADAVFLRPRPGLDYGECGSWIFCRKFEAPQVFAITRGGDASLAVSSLDLVFADGDSALQIV